MSQQPLLAACKQAEHSEASVRAAALLHIARVVACTDQAAAEQLLDQGITLAKGLEGPAAQMLLSNAVYLAAAVSMKGALPLYEQHKRVSPFGGSMIAWVNAMAQHGHINDALAYLRDPLPGDRFPLRFAMNLARECRDDDTRREVLELAIREWRNPAPREVGLEERIAIPSFTGLFGRYWGLLPTGVAAPILRDLIDQIRATNAEPIKYQLTGNPEDPQLASDQEFQFFILVPALQELEPELARSIMEARPQLAKAVTQFPLGIRSVQGAQGKYDAGRDDLVFVGDSELMPIAEALATNFEAALRHADESFADDMDSEFPNSAYKECWMSAREFRHILFKAGQHLGPAAEKFLERIPDADLRLFAQIELCAAIAGLPEMGGLTTQFRQKQTPPSAADFEQIWGSVLPGISCPKCDWTPRVRNVWSCNCGQQWNTFDTRGLCPGCEYQWDVTQCLQCGATSPHSDWYSDSFENRSN